MFIKWCMLSFVLDISNSINFFVLILTSFKLFPLHLSKMRIKWNLKFFNRISASSANFNDKEFN